MRKDVKNIDMIYVLVVFVLLLITPIRVVITKDETRSDIDFTSRGSSICVWI